MTPKIPRTDERNYSVRLRELMTEVGIASFRQLYRSAQTSASTINKLRSGNVAALSWQTIVKISDSLKLAPSELIEYFSANALITAPLPEQERELLLAEFQYQSLQTLESFLTYFPTAKAAALQNPNFPATKLLPLIGAIDRLLAQWHVTAIGTVGEELPYDPQFHQLIEGHAHPQELVTVRYVGYRQPERLLFRAKVSR